MSTGTVTHLCAISPSDHLPSFWRARHGKPHLLMCCNRYCLQMELDKMVHDLEQVAPRDFLVKRTDNIIELDGGGRIFLRVVNSEDSLFHATAGFEFGSVRHCGGELIKPQFVEMARTRIR